MITQDLGIATAYGYAKSKGYTGTEAEFAELMASYASTAQTAIEAADRAVEANTAAQSAKTDAAASKTAAQTAAQTATTKASEASQSASTATTKASEASTSADTASAAATSASTSAQTATTAASTANTKASEAAVSANTATTAKTDAETARDAAAQSASEAAESARTLTIDATLTQSGQAADAKAVGEKLTDLKSALSANESKTEFAIDEFEDTGLWQQTAAQLTPTNSVINSAGNETSGDSFRHLEKSVNPGELYFVSGHKYSNSFPCYLFLNSSTVVSYETGEASGKFTDLMIVIPSGINKLIVNGSSTNIPIIATRSGIKAGTHSEIMDIRSVLAKPYSDLTITTSEGVYSKDNSYNSIDTFKHTIISVTEGDTIKFSTYRVSDYYPAYVFRNSNGVVDYEDDLSNGAVYDIEVNVPSGATDMVINSNASVSISVAKKVAVEAAAKTDLNNKADKPNDWHEVTGTLTTGKLYASPITQASGAAWSYRSYTDNSGFENNSVKVNGVHFNDTFPIVCFLDGNGTLISKLTGFSGNTDCEDLILSSIPVNCRTIVVNNTEGVRGTGSVPQIFVEDGKITVDQCAINYAKREATKATQYKNLPTGYEGKKIAFFGTSIMSAAVYNIPRYAAEVLGFDIINEALGSSCARRGWKSRETANDPYGWTGTSWQNVFLAMGASLAEKQDLIDNYTTKWADLLGGDYEGSSGDGTGTGKPQTLDAEWIEKIKNASYEKKLIPYLDGTKPMPDLFIFEHGYNDYDPNDPLTGEVQNESSLDMSVYSDAMYFYIQKIFEANPQAKVMICSHYENQTARGDVVWSAQKELASYHGLWFCDVANGIGWTQRKVKTTGYWDTTTHLWVPSGGLLQTMTRKQQCLYDDLHPHNDWSGNASRREGQIIAQFIRSHIVL